MHTRSTITRGVTLNKLLEQFPCSEINALLHEHHLHVALNSEHEIMALLDLLHAQRTLSNEAAQHLLKLTNLRCHVHAIRHNRQRIQKPRVR